MAHHEFVSILAGLRACHSNFIDIRLSHCRHFRMSTFTFHRWLSHARIHRLHGTLLLPIPGLAMARIVLTTYYCFMFTLLRNQQFGGFNGSHGIWRAMTYLATNRSTAASFWLDFQPQRLI